MATETSGLIQHIQSNDESMTDEALSRILGLPVKRFTALKDGEKDGTRNVNTALGILADRIGYGDAGFSRSVAAKMRVGSHVQYNGETCQILGVVKSGVNAPYFSLLGTEQIYTGVSFRFCQPVPTTNEPAVVEPVSENGATEPTPITEGSRPKKHVGN